MKRMTNSAVVGVLTSRLAVVQGVLGQTGVISTPESTPWPKLTKNAAIPYDAGWLVPTATASTRVDFSRTKSVHVDKEE